MNEPKCGLSNNLIEGFLYEFLAEWRDVEGIIDSVYDRFGEKMCVPGDLTNSGEKRYIRKVKKILTRGVMNSIYQYDEKSESYKNAE